MTIAAFTILAATFWRHVEMVEADREEPLHIARDRAAELAALHEAALALTADLDLDLVLRRAVERAAERCGRRRPQIEETDGPQRRRWTAQAGGRRPGGPG